MPPEDPLQIAGATIAEKYFVESFVVEGGFSLLYRAQHKVWKQPVALKFLKILSTVNAQDRQNLLDSFVQEGALLRELSSRTASILQAHDVGTMTCPNGEWYPYLVLEWLDGKPLDLVLLEEHERRVAPWTLQEMMQLIEPAAAALEVVHRRGISHRDIKPANLFVIGEPRHHEAFIKVLDFGIAKVVNDLAELSAKHAKTGKGITSFTPWYGAPEQFSRKYGATGPWTDVYALALVMVEMMTLSAPLVGTEVPELAMETTDPNQRPTPRTKGVQISDALENVFLKALAVRPEYRYQSAGEFWNDLRLAIGQTPIRMTATPGSVEFAPATTSGYPGQANSAVGSLTTPLATAKTFVGSSTEQPSVGPIRTSVTTQSSPSSHLGAILGICALLGVIVLGVIVLMRGPKTPSDGDKAAAGVPKASVQASSTAPPPVTCPAGMAKIPGKKFFMGLDKEIALPFEKPQHQVSLSTYCMDINEVTVEAYRKCSDKGECPRAPVTVDWPKITEKDKKMYGELCNMDRPGRDRNPVNCVPWSMAKQYCEANKKRLPTSAEWEFAVRGSDGRIYPWGDEPPDASRLNACGKECLEWGKRQGITTLTAMHEFDDGFPTTAPVGSFPKGQTIYGLHDMIGNVMEWVADWNGPYTKDAQTNPTGPEKGTDRVIRGGAWNAGNMIWVRPSFRFKFPPEVRSHGVGFRCAADFGK
jgi:eukaryotic-like serine/threonine-protein kinase